MAVRITQFEDLDAWREARRLVAHAYGLMSHRDLQKDFGLRDQIQRAAVSVMNNIAEGFERVSTMEKVRFYSIARASCGEVRSMLYVIEDLVPDLTGQTGEIRSHSIRTGKLISGLIRSTENRSEPNP